MFAAFKVNVDHVAFVALAPDLQAKLGPPNFELGELPWTYALGQFAQAFPAVQERHH